MRLPHEKTLLDLLFDRYPHLSAYRSVTIVAHDNLIMYVIMCGSAPGSRTGTTRNIKLLNKYSIYEDKLIRFIKCSTFKIKTDMII